MSQLLWEVDDDLIPLENIPMCSLSSERLASKHNLSAAS